MSTVTANTPSGVTQEFESSLDSLKLYRENEAGDTASGTIDLTLNGVTKTVDCTVVEGVGLTITDDVLKSFTADPAAGASGAEDPQLLEYVRKSLLPLVVRDHVYQDGTTESLPARAAGWEDGISDIRRDASGNVASWQAQVTLADHASNPLGRYEVRVDMVNNMGYPYLSTDDFGRLRNAQHSVAQAAADPAPDLVQYVQDNLLQLIPEGYFYKEGSSEYLTAQAAGWEVAIGDIQRDAGGNVASWRSRVTLSDYSSNPLGEFEVRVAMEGSIGYPYLSAEDFDRLYAAQQDADGGEFTLPSAATVLSGFKDEYRYQGTTPDSRRLFFYRADESSYIVDIDVWIDVDTQLDDVQLGNALGDDGYAITHLQLTKQVGDQTATLTLNDKSSRLCVDASHYWVEFSYDALSEIESAQPGA